MHPLLGVVGTILWVSYDQPGSECDVVLNMIYFLIMFFRALNNLNCARSLCRYVVTGIRPWTHILLLKIYLVGLPATFNILIPTVRRSHAQYCGIVGTFQAGTSAYIWRQQQRGFNILWYQGWQRTWRWWIQLDWSPTLIYIFRVLVCIIFFISKIIFSIILALMNHNYEMISYNTFENTTR